MGEPLRLEEGPMRCPRCEAPLSTRSQGAHEARCARATPEERAAFRASRWVAWPKPRPPKAPPPPPGVRRVPRVPPEDMSPERRARYLRVEAIATAAVREGLDAQTICERWDITTREWPSLYTALWRRGVRLGQASGVGGGHG
jgi:hypothetical protein